MFALLCSLLFLSGCFWEEENDNSTQSSDVQDDEWEEAKIILAIGDSLTAGYSLPIEDSYPSQLEALLSDNGYEYEIINAGVSGNTSAQILERLNLYLEDEDEIPELAILVAWWNDGLRGQSIESLEENLIKITKRLQEKWVVVVIWWMQIPPNRWLKYYNDFKKVYKKVAKATDAELIPFFLEDVAWMWAYNLPDKIHPNKDGYAIVAENTYKFLKKEKLINDD
jgi:acyl-CoA thioesterase-1